MFISIKPSFDGYQIVLNENEFTIGGHKICTISEKKIFQGATCTIFQGAFDKLSTISGLMCKTPFLNQRRIDRFRTRSPYLICQFHRRISCSVLRSETKQLVVKKQETFKTIVRSIVQHSFKYLPLDS